MPTPKKYESDAERQKAFRERQKQARGSALVKGAPAPPAIATMPGMARWKALHEQARQALATMAQEMQEYHADRSEQWQESDKGEAFQALIDAAEDLSVTVEGFTFE